MDPLHHHPVPLDRLIRRQRGADPLISQIAATATPAGANPAVTTTPVAAATTTSAAPAVTATTTSAAAATTPSSSSVAAAESSSEISSSSSSAPAESSSSVVDSSTSTTSSAAATTSTSAAASSSSTSSSTTTTTSSAARETESSLSSSSLSSSSAAASTTVVVVSGVTQAVSTTGSSSSAALASSTSGSSGSSISTGGVIGIVAGAVVGVVVVAAFIAFLLKKHWSRNGDDDQISPFDKDEFRRASVMLDDDDEAYAQSFHSYGAAAGGHPQHLGGHSPQMSEYSMREMAPPAAAMVGRSNASLPGLARGGTLNNPRPPTALINHYNHQQMMPSFQPGQVVPTSPSPPMMQYGNFSPPPPAVAAFGAPEQRPMDMYGGYPVAPAQQRQLDMVGGLRAPNQYDNAGGNWQGQGQGQGQSQQGYPNLSRANSQASAYSQLSDGQGQGRAMIPAALRPGGSQSAHGHGGPAVGHPDDRPLSLVHEDDEPYSPSNPTFSPQAQSHFQEELRSGTPVNSNVQQTFFSHGRADSGGAGVGHGVGMAMSGVTGGEWDDDQEMEMKRERRLSIRNGGLNQFDERDEEDPYGGMH
ncbi:hypothetical protein JCM1841_004707 [Sporobolomyces salmonicolor]